MVLWPSWAKTRTTDKILKVKTLLVKKLIVTLCNQTLIKCGFPYKLPNLSNLNPIEMESPQRARTCNGKRDQPQPK